MIEALPKSFLKIYSCGRLICMLGFFSSLAWAKAKINFKLF